MNQEDRQEDICDPIRGFGYDFSEAQWLQIHEARERKRLTFQRREYCQGQGTTWGFADPLYYKSTFRNTPKSYFKTRSFGFAKYPWPFPSTYSLNPQTLHTQKNFPELRGIKKSSQKFKKHLQSGLSLVNDVSYSAGHSPDLPQGAYSTPPAL